MIYYVEALITDASGYSSAKAYTFKTNVDDFKQGDTAVAHVNGNPSMVLIKGYTEKPSFKCKWILKQVNLQEMIDNLDRLEGTE